MKEIKIIIAGSRTFNNYQLLSSIVEHIINTKLYKKGYKHENIEIVCGMAKGADLLGAKFAEHNGFAIKNFPADWNTYGKKAGYIRNEQMAKYSSYRKGYGALIAFWDEKSKGTKHMINLARKYGLKIFVYNFENNTWWMK